MPNRWSPLSRDLHMFKTTGFVSMVMAIAMTIAPGIMTVGAERNSVKMHVVEITGFKFVPDSINVSPGDTITWVNRDIVPHTATGVNGSWGTGLLNQNESKSIVFSKNMASAYACRFHVNMTGTVALVNRVEPGGI